MSKFEMNKLAIILAIEEIIFTTLYIIFMVNVI